LDERNIKKGAINISPQGYFLCSAANSHHLSNKKNHYILTMTNEADIRKLHHVALVYIAVRLGKENSFAEVALTDNNVFPKSKTQMCYPPNHTSSGRTKTFTGNARHIYNQLRQEKAEVALGEAFYPKIGQ
jgi:hypothetical protein